MYIPMVRKGTRTGTLALCLALLAPGLPALEKVLELGKDALWAQVRDFAGVTCAPGRWGFQDLVLSAGEYPPAPDTELLLHFDEPGQPDAAGGWAFASAAPGFSAAAAAMGSGSAVFNGAGTGIALSAPGGSLFAEGAAWADFTIEFWLYTATLDNGQGVLSWDGSTRQGEGAKARLVPQSLRCAIRDRKVSWDFSAFFALPTGGWIPAVLVGSTQLLPRAWHHHLVRFDSRTGLLEYLLDGAPEAILHVTSNGSESGTVAEPRIGKEYSGPLVLGAGLTGFLDELRISRRFVDNPTLTRFLGRTGTATTEVLDLGFSGTRIIRIEAVTSTPSDTGVEFYSQVSDTWTRQKLLKSPTAWAPFVPGDLKGGMRGRYLQLMVELFPDGTRTQSPRVSSLRVIYEPNLPPMPPAGLAAVPGNGTVTLSWRKVNDLNVKGYSVSYGSAPHTYLGTEAAQGASPIDAGDVTRIEIGGLDNGSLYYFAVAAYDDSEPRQQSEFSAEASARPSRIYP